MLSSCNGRFRNTHAVTNDMLLRGHSILVAFSVDLLWNTAVRIRFKDDPYMNAEGLGTIKVAREPEEAVNQPGHENGE